MPDALAGLVLVAIGSAAGGMARFLLTSVVTARFGEVFPWGTLTVNIAGSLAIGALAAALGGPFGGQAALWQLAVVGGLGGFTTASAFSLQTLTLANTGALRHAAAYVASSVVMCLAAAAGGYIVVASVS
jgi:fluoride exporter